MRAVQPRAYALGYFMAPLTGLLTCGGIFPTYNRELLRHAANSP
ncbi:hypothetical protein SBA2_100020 [Acidobacteriia bacterium SbA2]|nr:hypothetical protein SBA2_100020 [Acidobacteriia bacterium SbA2]